MITVSQVLRWVSGFNPGSDIRARDSQMATLALLRDTPRPFDRAQYDPGHVTASAVVLSPDRTSVLLILHPHLNRWLQPGGHLEPSDPDVVAAASREVREETCVSLKAEIPPRLVGIDVHPIPARGAERAHKHHDLVFVMVAEQTSPMPREGTLRMTWCPVDHLDQFQADGALRSAVMAALKRDHR